MIRMTLLAALLVQIGCNPRGGDGDLAPPAGDGGSADARVDGGGPDGGEADGGGAGDAFTSDPDGAAPPPLFSPDGPPAEAAAAALIATWYTRPSTEAEARANTEAAGAARATLREAGSAGADAIAARCADLPDAHRDHLHCARLLALVESPASLAYLDRLARLADAPLPEGAHPTAPAPIALARQGAGWALGRRVAAGSDAATVTLLEQARRPEHPEIRRRAVHLLLGAGPRHRLKPRLRAVLPEADHHLMYEVRR